MTTVAVNDCSIAYRPGGLLEGSLWAACQLIVCYTPLRLSWILRVQETGLHTINLGILLHLWYMFPC